MTLTEYRETYSWQQAIELSPKLMALAEELPAAEAMGMSLQLRQMMVELPASIAADLLKNREARLADILKLTTVLELIDRVYPALDTAETRNAADILMQRMVSANFAEIRGGATLSTTISPAAAPVPPAETAVEPAATPVLPAEVAAKPETPEPAESPVPTNVTVTQDGDVHPDSE